MRTSNLWERKSVNRPTTNYCRPIAISRNYLRICGIWEQPLLRPIGSGDCIAGSALERDSKEKKLLSLGDEKDPSNYGCSLTASFFCMLSHRQHGTLDRTNIEFTQTTFIPKHSTSCLYCLFSWSFSFLTCKMHFLKNRIGSFIVMKWPSLFLVIFLVLKYFILILSHVLLFKLGACMPICFHSFISNISILYNIYIYAHT